MSEPPAVAAGEQRAPSARHLPALDGVRGLAVLTVFVFHYGGGTHSSMPAMRLFGDINKGGWSGVVLFFVLSGFLITGILWDSFEDPHWWRKFFARRTLRIFPLYFLALLLFLLMTIPEGDFHNALRRIWIFAFFLENVPKLADVASNLRSVLDTSHLWSIAVEEQFYLLWPFLLVIQPSRSSAKRLCEAIFVVSAGFRFYIWWFTPEPRQWVPFLVTQAGALAAGGWLALGYRGAEWPRILRAAPFAAVIGLVGFVVAGALSESFQTTGRYMMTFGLPFATLLFAAVVALAMTPGLLQHFFSMRWLRGLGGISYGVYVFHVLLMHAFDAIAQYLAGGRPQMQYLAVRFVVAAVGALVVAQLSFHLYEKQFLRLKKYFVPQRSKGGQLSIDSPLSRHGKVGAFGR